MTEGQGPRGHAPGSAAPQSVASPPVLPPAPVVAGSLGVLGGTFDPIHHGHLAIAEEAREALGLETVRFVPAAASPFKADRAVTPGEHRLAMVEAAIAGNPSFEVSRMELDRPAPSYTVDTIEALAAEGPSTLWLILSSEALEGLPRWRDPSRILDMARLAVVPRAGFDPLGPAWVAEHLPGREDRFTFLPGPLLPISGSVVRRRAAAGRSVRYLVPDGVARYIAQHALYAQPA
ncbi:MAG TPA: nicotinate-nucleotide adenylyltransferase [Candidatus Limnocylindrales bacterium]|nr:nicotinate-nucleotide adenylyltransferase [Candidatus Limnocylindrales bacterium]